MLWKFRQCLHATGFIHPGSALAITVYIEQCHLQPTFCWPLQSPAPVHCKDSRGAWSPSQACILTPKGRALPELCNVANSEHSNHKSSESQVVFNLLMLTFEPHLHNRSDKCNAGFEHHPRLIRAFSFIPAQRTVNLAEAKWHCRTQPGVHCDYLKTLMNAAGALCTQKPDGLCTSVHVHSCADMKITCKLSAQDM